MASYVDPTAAAIEHCESMAGLHGDMSEKYNQFAQWIREKLWHPLTVAVLEMVSDASQLRTLPDGSNGFLALYNVLLPIHSKLNPTSWAQIAAHVCRSMDLVGARAVLEDLIPKSEPEEQLYLESTLQLLVLSNNPSTEDLAKVYSVLMQSKKSKVDHKVAQAALYRALFTYYKIVGPPQDFYHAALEFLSVDENSHDDYPTLAQDVVLSALTGQGVYHLQTDHPVLKHLKEPWLLELLQTVAEGDIAKFEALSQQYATQISAQPALTSRSTEITEKLTLLALCRMVFTRESHDRVLTLEEVAEELKIPLDQVEWVVMRALSVGLIKGSIDQVDGTVQVSWVQPRALSPMQCRDLSNRLDAWATKSTETREQMMIPMSSNA